MTDNGAPASGGTDLRFSLFADAVGGTAISSPMDVPDAMISNGLFNVLLDFGSIPFDGSDRWLEVAVRPGAGEGALTTLTPRHKITTTPQAIHALQAANYSGAISANQLAGHYTNAVSFTHPASQFAGDGAGLTNLDGRSVTFTAATLLERGVSNVIWLAPRQDGRDGIGTPTDPRDASTAIKFDAIISNATENTVIRLLPGLFETRGYAHSIAEGAFYRSGQSLIGSGINATVLRVSPLQTDYVVRAITDGQFPGTGIPRFASNVVVQDLTVDCNGHNLSPSNHLTAVEIYGTGARIENVRAINAKPGFAGVGTAGRECFVLATGTNGLIRDCEVTQVIPGLPGVVGFSGLSTARGGLIDNNRVDLSGTIGGPGAHIAIQVGDRNVIRNNYVVSAGFGLFIDTPPASDFVVVGNRVFNCSRAIIIGPATGPSDGVTNGIISGNILAINPAGIGVQCQPLNGSSLRNIMIHDNLIRYRDSGGSGGTAFFLRDASNLILHNNRVAEGMVASVANVTNLQTLNNRSFSGAPIAGLPE